MSANMTILIMYQWHDIVGIGSNGQTFVMNAEQVANPGGWVRWVDLWWIVIVEHRHLFQYGFCFKCDFTQSEPDL